MSFTNQMLGALGTATGALAAGEHIAEQRKDREQQALDRGNQAEAERGSSKGKRSHRLRKEKSKINHSTNRS